MKETNRYLNLHALLSLIVLVSVVVWAAVPADSAEPSIPAELAGSWEGTLDTGQQRLRLIFHVEDSETGELTATLDSPDQGSHGIPIAAVELDGESVRFEVKIISAVYAGKLSDNRDTIEGEWRQSGLAVPLRVERVENDLAEDEPKGP